LKKGESRRIMGETMHKIYIPIEITVFVKDATESLKSLEVSEKSDLIADTSEKKNLLFGIVDNKNSDCSNSESCCINYTTGEYISGSLGEVK